MILHHHLSNDKIERLFGRIHLPDHPNREKLRMPFTYRTIHAVLDEFTSNSIAFDFDSLLDCRFHRVGLLFLCAAGISAPSTYPAMLDELIVVVPFASGASVGGHFLIFDKCIDMSRHKK
jgi:hypothetical protein